MIVNNFDRARIEKNFPGAQLRELDAGEDFQAGKTYLCGYWHQFFKVIEIRHNVPVWDTVYTVQWEDGEINSHSTGPDRKWDCEIVTA